MSHLGDGGLHVKGAMCNFGFHRTESFLLFLLIDFLHHALGHSLQGFFLQLPAVESHRQVSVSSLAGGWHSWLNHSTPLYLSLLPFPVCRKQEFPFVLLLHDEKQLANSG